MRKNIISIVTIITKDNKGQLLTRTQTILNIFYKIKHTVENSEFEGSKVRVYNK